MARSRQRAARSSRAPQTAKPRTDIYTALLVVSLLAQIAGAVFLYFDYDHFKTSAAPVVNANVPSPQQPVNNPAPVPGQ